MSRTAARFQQLVEFYFPRGELLDLRYGKRFGAHLFVVDEPRGSDVRRTLGSWGRGQLITEQSSMGLLHPERLVFRYEQHMALAFRIAEQPRSALLLGLGGGAMLRHAAARFPECRLTVVELDETVIELARHWFYIDRPVVADDALSFVAETHERYDVILVDLYGAAGVRPLRAGFWEHCLAALADGGCLAANWADFTVNQLAERSAAALASCAAESIYVTPSGLRDNLIQFSSHGTGLPDRIRALARPRGPLARCVITESYPRRVPA